MINYIDKDGAIQVWGWDAKNGDDDALLGNIRKDAEGNHWFYPSNNIVLCNGHIRRIGSKLSNLNGIC
jgi:hypothetical protein